MKKALSLFLSILMIFGTFAALPTTAFSEPPLCDEVEATSNCDSICKYGNAVSDVSFDDVTQNISIGYSAEGFDDKDIKWQIKTGDNTYESFIDYCVNRLMSYDNFILGTYRYVTYVFVDYWSTGDPEAMFNSSTKVFIDNQEWSVLEVVNEYTLKIASPDYVLSEDDLISNVTATSNIDEKLVYDAPIGPLLVTFNFDNDIFEVSNKRYLERIAWEYGPTSGRKFLEYGTYIFTATLTVAEPSGGEKKKVFTRDASLTVNGKSWSVEYVDCYTVNITSHEYYVRNPDNRTNFTATSNMSSYLVADKTIRDAPTFTLTEAKTEGGKNVNVDFNACPDEYLRGGRLVKYATEPGETEKTYYLGPNQNLCTPEAGKYYYIMSVEVEGSGAFIDADSEIVIDGNKWTFVSESDNMYAIKSPDFNLTPIIDNVSLTSNLSSVMKFKNSTDTSLVSITGNNNKISVSNIRYHKRQGKTDTYSNISTETEFVHNYYKAVAELNVNPDYLSKAKFADNLVVYVDGIPWDVYNVSESSVTIRSRAVLIRDPASEIKTIKATSNLKKFNAEGCSTSGGVSFSSITTDFKRCAVKVDFKCYPEGDNNYNGKYGTFVRLADSTNKKELRFNDYDNPSNLPAGTYCYETTVTVSASEITPYIPYVDDNTEFIIDGKNWRIIGELGDDILIIRSPEFVIEHIWGEPVTVARNIKKYTCQKCNAVKVVAFGNYYVTEADAKEVAASERLTKRKPKTPTVSRKGKKMTVKWKKVADASGYQIQYSTNKKFKKAKTVNVKGSKASKKQIKKLKNNKKYYVRVRAYRTVGKVNGKTVGKSVGKTVGAKYGKTVQRTVGKDYSKWSKTKVVKSK